MDLLIDKIVNPQGILGEVKVLPYTDGAEVFCGLRRVFIDGTEYKILNARVGDGIAYLALRGVPDRNAAELLRDRELTLPREEAPEPDEGSYYIADVLGKISVRRRRIFTRLKRKTGKFYFPRRRALFFP